MRKKIALLTMAAMFISISLCLVADEQPQIPKKEFAGQSIYRVTKVVDGDTVNILMDGKETRVRLIGVDAQETVHPSKPVEHYGIEASRFTENLLGGEDVYIEREPGMNMDNYGRTLLYLYRAPDGLFVNLEIIRQGYGHAYTTYPFQQMELFRYYEGRARDLGKGLWKESDAGTTQTKTGAIKKDVTQPEPQPASGTIVYITKTGSKYHRDGCRYLSRSKIPISLEEARKRYSPCSVCNPPR